MIEILTKTTAVRTPVLPEVKELIQQIPVDYDGVRQYKTSIVEWLRPVIDLQDFYVYPTNGITEGLNWWYDKENRSVSMKDGEYQWVKPKLGTEEIFYVSCPSSIDGNFCEIPDDIPVALDLAYVGSTVTKPIKIQKNVEYVFYSFSKSFGVRNIRTGWIFCRNEDVRLTSLIDSAKYYNYYANDVAEKIMSAFDIDYVHNRLNKEQKRICNNLNISPSDSVWIATSEDEQFKKLRRTSNKARLCLSGVYDYES